MCVVVSGDVGYFVLVVSYGAGVPTEFEQNEDKFSHVQFAVFDGRTTMHGILIQNELLHFNDSNEIRKNVNPFEEWKFMRRLRINIFPHFILARSYSLNFSYYVLRIAWWDR